MARIYVTKSQSPENGSRLCKNSLTKTNMPNQDVSQSPENGSRLCKQGLFVQAFHGEEGVVAIP